jgi:hypothetical protein
MDKMTRPTPEETRRIQEYIAAKVVEMTLAFGKMDGKELTKDDWGSDQVQNFLKAEADVIEWLAFINDWAPGIKKLSFLHDEIIAFFASGNERDKFIFDEVCERIRDRKE